MRLSNILTSVTIAASSLLDVVQARAVFAHYMLGTITEEHAHKDIDDAITMGLDGFALNIGNPLEKFVTDSLGYLFGYAAYRGFKLYISMDLYASGDACYKGAKSCNGPFDYKTIFTNFLGSTAYYKGPNGLPMISTFSTGGLFNTTFASWKATLANQMYFIPDFDETTGYSTSDPEWWKYWGSQVDGIFSWETAWPVIGQLNDGDVRTDKTVMNGAKAHGKGFMIGLSMLQYKNSYGTNLYRRGELNLPKRMRNILSMSPLPDFVQILTWNDGPEGHYIGNLWPEQNTDAQPARYATQSGSDHTAINPLLTSFINAYRSGVSDRSMAPPNGAQAVGAVWYKTILQSSTCPFDGYGQYFNKPNGSQSGSDVLNWAVVLPPGASGGVRLESNGKILQQLYVGPGLNFGSATGAVAGTQQLILELNGQTYHASGGRCISSSCPEGIYNYNPQIVGITNQGAAVARCWQVYGTPVAVKDQKTNTYYAIDGVSKSVIQAGASCVDLEGTLKSPRVWDKLTGKVGLPLDAGMWSVADTTPEFKLQLDNYQGKDWLFEFSNPTGNGQNLATCGVTHQCERPNCQNLNAGGTLPFSAVQYMVEVSAVNLNLYMAHLYQAAIQAENKFAGTQAYITEHFWPYQDTSHDGPLDQILNALIAAVAIIGVVVAPEVVAVAAGAEIVKGIILGIVTELGPKGDSPLGHLAALEVIANKTTSSVQQTVQRLDTDFLTLGKSGTISLVDLFDNGKWVDFRRIPIVVGKKSGTAAYPSISEDEIADYFYKQMLASLVNYSWMRQNVFLMRYPMPKDTFDSRYSKAGNDDTRLRFWYKGYGYYYQAALPFKVGVEIVPLSDNPWGWELLWDGSIPFSTWDVVQSSADAFEASGFKYKVGDLQVNDILKGSYTNSHESFQIPGVFTIPICDQSSQQLTIDQFFDALNLPASHIGRRNFCLCDPDKNGARMRDVIDIDQFWGRYCQGH